MTWAPPAVRPSADWVADLEGIIVDCRGWSGKAIRADAFAGLPIEGPAVLVATG